METAAPPRLSSRGFVWIVAATTLVFASFGVVVLALPLYVNDVLDGSDVAVGVAIGSASIGAIVMGPVAGRVADRRGRRIVLVASAAVMAAGYLVLALQPPLGVIVPLRVVAGAAEAAFVVAGYTMATDLAPADRRGEAISLITAGSYCGLAVGPILANVIVDARGFGLAWLVALASAVAAGVIAFRLPESRPDSEEEAPGGWLPPRAALLPGAVLLLALLGFGGFNAFAALHAREVGLSRPGLVFLLFAGVVIAVRVVGRTLPDRLGARHSASLACGAVAVGLAVVALWESVPGLLLGTAIFALGQAFAYPAIALLATARASAIERSAVLGSVIAFIDVALASGAFVLGLVASAWGYPAVFAAGAVSALGGLVLLWSMRDLEPGRARLPAGARARPEEP